MKSTVSSFLIGILFSLGLGLSGMTSPARVVGFLDIFGVWDPSLMFVMMGALAVHMILYRLILKRKSPLFAETFQIPTKKEITKPLVIGAALFGLGWGLAGYCPAPAITSLMSFTIEPLIFVMSMLAGMLLHRLIRKAS